VPKLVLDILLGLPGPSRRATLVSNGIELFLLRDSPSTDIDTRIWACGSFVLHDLNSIADHTYVSPYGARYSPELAETPLIWSAFLFVILRLSNGSSCFDFDMA
jgi:hypothetical protein